MKKLFNELKTLLRQIPGVVTTLFCLSIVLMNLSANKTIVSVGDWFALDGGILVSWLSFLTMDVVTKAFGPRKANMLAVVAIGVNLLACLILYLVSVIPSTADDYSKLNEIFGGTWFILLSSSVAFLASAFINNGLNWTVGKMFKKNPDGRLAYITRTYTSTVVGQFLDNLIFSVLTFMIFAPIFWDGFSWTFLQCVMCALTGAVAELLMEIIFSPIGYSICKRWKKEGIGYESLDNRN